MTRIVSTLLLFTALAAAVERRAIFPEGAKPGGPYSPGVLVGDFLYVAGQGGKTPQEALDRIRIIVQAAGLTMEHVVYSQVYVHRDLEMATLDRVWNEYFPSNPPARAVAGIYRMPTDALVQINATAVRDLQMKKQAPGGVYAAGRLYLHAHYGKDTAEALGKVAESLKAAGMGFEHMVMVHPWLTSAVPMGEMNREYARHFEYGNTPARATIQMTFLPGGANIAFTGVAVRDLTQRRAVRPKNMAPSPTASPCVWAAETLFCSSKSGFIPGPNGGIYADSVEDQVRQSLRNLLDNLEEAGLDFSHTVASLVHLDDIGDFAKMNSIYAKYFSGVAPARTTVANLKPVESRARNQNGQAPKLEEIAIIAVR
jgi:enamine deaminase RidA (YjgF/YER057c/UK114 family)